MVWTEVDDHDFTTEIKAHGWEAKRKLGIGSTGAVWYAVRTGQSETKESAEQVAIKAYRIQQRDESDGRYLYNEVLRQLQLFHPHIIQFRSLIPTKNYLCLVMEYANAGDLFKFTKQTRALPEAAARFIFQQLILVLQYCHHDEINMYIRDVKPSNLLLVWNSSGMPLVKLTDFNLAKDISLEGPAVTPVGCTMWMSPQAVQNRARPYAEMIPFGPICDIWSAGVTLYYLLYTKWPFSDKTILEWTLEGSRVLPEKVEYPTRNEHGEVSPQVINLMKRIFACGNMNTIEEYKKQRGITIDDIIKDEWFKKDLPEEALKMTEECIQKTKERRKSDSYKNLLSELKKAALCMGAEQTADKLTSAQVHDEQNADRLKSTQVSAPAG